MTSTKMDTATPSLGGGGTGAQQGPQPSKIKIKFKRGTVFNTAGAEASSGLDLSPGRIPVRLSPQAAAKRKKVTNEMGCENEELVAKRVKMGDDGTVMESNSATDDSPQVKDATSPVSSMASTATAATTATTTTGASIPAGVNLTIRKKVPTLQPASIFRKLARNLSAQPVLLDQLREYRSSITGRRQDDAKLIASLQAKLSAATKGAAEKELKAAEELKASQEMVLFWTDSCNEEYEATMLLRQRLGELVGKIKDVREADAIGDSNFGCGEGVDMEFAMKKLGVELTDIVAEKRERVV